jgi:hypothetical protein
MAIARSMDGQSLLDVSTGFEDEGYLIPMLILFCADDIDSKFLMDPQGDALLFNFLHVSVPHSVEHCSNPQALW